MSHKLKMLTKNSFLDRINKIYKIFGDKAALSIL